MQDFFIKLGNLSFYSSITTAKKYYDLIKDKKPEPAVFHRPGAPKALRRAAMQGVGLPARWPSGNAGDAGRRADSEPHPPRT